MGTAVDDAGRVPRPGARLEFPDPTLRPWPGFALAADAAVRQLSDLVGMDLWLVTYLDGDRQVVVAAAGAWADLAPAGAAFGWADSFCLRMVTRRGPMVAPDVQFVEEYAVLAAGVYARVRAYLGVPLIIDDDRVFGTLCAFAGAAKPPILTRSLSLVQFVGRMLSTVLAREQHAHHRSEEAAMAYALAERDRLTGLRNWRGWESALVQEDERSRRYGSAATVLVVDLDDLGPANDRDGGVLAEYAGVLQATGRHGDVLARLGGEFRVLAVECDAAAARVLVARLRAQLRAAGGLPSIGAATRRAGEDLAATSRRADRAMHRAKRRQQRLAAADVRPARPSRHVRN